MGLTCKTFSILILLPFLLGCKNNFGTESNHTDMKVSGDAPAQKMKKLFLQSYGPENLELELRSPYAEGYTKQNYLHANNLSITLYEKGKQSSQIDADEGILMSGRKDIENPTLAIDKIEGLVLRGGDMFLDGNVVVISTDGAKLKTDWIWFDSATDLIKSSAPVTIEREDSIQTGVGLEATSDMSTVKIFNQELTIIDDEIEE